MFLGCGFFLLESEQNNTPVLLFLFHCVNRKVSSLILQFSCLISSPGREGTSLCVPPQDLHPLLAVPTFSGSEWSSGHELTQQCRPRQGLSSRSHPGRATRLVLPDAYQEKSCQGRSCTKLLPRQAGTRGWGGCCHPSQISYRGWEFCQMSSLMLITISSAVFLSFNLNFYPLNLFKALISHYRSTIIWVSLNPPCIFSPSTPRGHAELLLRYCKTPSHGSCNVRGKGVLSGLAMSGHVLGNCDVPSMQRKGITPKSRTERVSCCPVSRADINSLSLGRQVSHQHLCWTPSSPRPWPRKEKC